MAAKNRDQLRNSTLGSRVWASFSYIYFAAVCACRYSGDDGIVVAGAGSERRANLPAQRRRCRADRRSHRLDGDSDPQLGGRRRRRRRRRATEPQPGRRVPRQPLGRHSQGLPGAGAPTAALGQLQQHAAIVGQGVGDQQSCGRQLQRYRHTHTHTHTFNGPFSETTRVSRY